MARLLRSFSSVTFAWLLLSALAPSAAVAQSYEQPPAHVSIAEGAVILERDGKTEASPASMPLLAGDRVRTQSGRAEILFADGSTLHLDAGTVVDFQSDEVIRLLDGRVRVNIAGPNRRIAYRIDAPSGWVEIAQPGEYRVALVGDSRPREVELAVLRGAAELTNEDGSTRVRAGERAFASVGVAPTQPYVFNSAAWDAFDQWSEARRDERLGVSAEYLPDDVQSYATTLSTYGSWQQEPTYGYVWYPRVAVGWRPYYYGRWSHYKHWGWTWIGHDPWAWPTHHYGRWGFSGSSWFWIPGRTWGPAWVSWAYAPGYVSWCPLGFNNAAVFGFGNYNVYRGHAYNRWHGWTVVPHARFGHGFVNVNVVNANNLDVRTRDAFAVRPTAPEFRGVAVPRGQAPIRVAGSRSGIAVPRGGSQGAPDAGDRATFRGGGVAGAPLAGPGFPAPAREPRTAIPRGAERSAQTGGAPQVDRSTSPSRSAVTRVQPTERQPSTPSRQAPVETMRPTAPSPDRMRAVPSRSNPEPGRQNLPATIYAIPRAQPSPQIDRNPAAPRPGDSPAYDPNPGMRRAPEQPQGGGSRAVPRGSESSPPPGSVPSYRAPERSVGRPSGGERPSGPPPSAAPPPNQSAPSRSAQPRSGGGSVGQPSGQGSQGSRSAPRSGGRGGQH